MERHGGLKIYGYSALSVQSWIQASGILILVVKVGEFSHLNEPSREILLNSC